MTTCRRDASPHTHTAGDAPTASRPDAPPPTLLRVFASSRESVTADPAAPPSPEVPTIEELTAVAVDCAYKRHVEAGPGLLETVYEVALARMLQDRGLQIKRQFPVRIQLMGLTFDEGFRADILVEDRLLIELKSVEALSPVHLKQGLTYLRLLNQPLGLLFNFGSATFKDGVKRIANHHRDFTLSRLRVNRCE